MPALEPPTRSFSAEKLWGTSPPGLCRSANSFSSSKHNGTHLGQEGTECVPLWVQGAMTEVAS